MPVSIARQRIPKNRATGRSIATRYGVANLQIPQVWVTEGSATFVVPKSGYWKFHAWGPGGSAIGGGTTVGGGGSGAYLEITKALRAGQTVSLVIGTPSS